ncbi:GntR family transcriptional regulator, partial [Pseudomonas syringae]|nr:GntR family transcriptional regulator [Pseudomonas syringae]
MLEIVGKATTTADDPETLSENVFRRIQSAIVKG